MNQKGVISIVIIIGIVTIAGIVGYFILNLRTQSPVPTLTPMPKPSPTPKSSPTPIAPEISDPNAETINGVAYLPPNQGEGLSIKYTLVVDGTTYHPFQPLRNSLPPGTKVDTKIINSTGQNMQLSDIRPGDALVIRESRGPCVMGVKGGWSGCIIKIYLIQDLTL